jgi:hypothetical protein
LAPLGVLNPPLGVLNPHCDYPAGKYKFTRLSILADLWQYSFNAASCNLAMYYPEANAIAPRRVDTESGTPAFKNVAARLAPVGTS